jgi:pimeloyl-ACP methyl ester carboxylesterase
MLPERETLQKSGSKLRPFLRQPICTIKSMPLFFATILLLQFVSSPLKSEVATGHFLKPTGQLFDVGGFRLHINCLGTGQPTVVLDSGIGGFSLEWLQIQTALSQQTRICAYDRAGYGWSDMGPLPRTSKRITLELHTLLNKAMIPGPYILVGHSFGGYTAQYFARQYPQETEAMLLLDSSHPQQFERMPRIEAATRDYPEKSRTYNIARTVLHEHYPQQTVARAYQLMSSWKYRFTFQEEMQSLPQSGLEILELEPQAAIPVVVITRGKRVWPNNAFGEQMEVSWMELQNELAVPDSTAVHLIAEHSGHSIHLDQPAIVITALRVLLNDRQTK